jgi:type IV pilus assembly protein PilB
MVATRLGDVLLKDKAITARDLERCLEIQKETGQKLSDVILGQNLIDEVSLIKILSKFSRLTVMDLSNFDPPPQVSNLVPPTLLVKYQIVPVGKRGDTLVLAASDPSQLQMIDDIRFQTRLRVELVLALPSSIKAIIERHYSYDLQKLASNIIDDGTQAEVIEEDVEKILEGGNEDDRPIIQFVTAILVDAIRKHASDVHIEPYDNDLRIRIRVDGELTDAIRPPPNIKSALVARIKVIAKMRLDEKRLPQDGRVRFRLAEGVVDFRVSTLPTVHGEKVVLRILDQTNALVRLEEVGFEKDDFEKFAKAIQNPWGMVLVTGATGSGKTTTLYSAINVLNRPNVNISTIEDPVEYNFQGINQVQVKEQIGLTFAECLRSLLRQDPDIILVGEIRDKETAEVAMKASLTGHLVLSTLHTNDAPSTITRLRDLGIDPFLINSALHLVVAQRLLRTNCTQCRAPDTRYTPDMLVKLGFPQNIIGKFQPMKGKGCPQCNGMGMKGRCAVHEVLTMTEALRDKIGLGATTDEVRKQAVADGMRTLKLNTMRKIIRGLVPMDELQML